MPVALRPKFDDFGYNGTPIHFASVGFHPAGQHLPATNVKSASIDRSPSEATTANVAPARINRTASGQRCKDRTDIGCSM